MIRSGGWGHRFRILAILVLLGAAAFPLYWMFVTSVTPSSELFAPSARLVPKLSEIGVKAMSDASRPVLSRLGESWSGLVAG